MPLSLQCRYSPETCSPHSPEQEGLEVALPLTSSFSAVRQLEVREWGLAIVHFMCKGLEKKIWAKLTFGMNGTCTGSSDMHGEVNEEGVQQSYTYLSCMVGMVALHSPFSLAYNFRTP